MSAIEAHDYTYTNAPLVEVIAEVRWKLTPLSSVPGGGVDPYFTKFRDFLAKKTEGLGFAYKEPVVEPDVPLEFIGGSPAIRFRPGAQKWPLFQVGPGLLTMNVTPPYGGWKNFRTTVATGLEFLMEFFEREAQLFQLSHLKLHYVDAFTSVHGMDVYERFTRDSLRFLRPVEGGVLEALEVDPARAAITGEIRLPLSKPEHSWFSYLVRPGTKLTDKAAIVDYSVNRSEDIRWPSDLLPWFDEAHDVCRKAFQASATDALLATFGEKVAL